MGIKVEGVERLGYLLRRGSDKAKKAAIDQLRQEAIDMRDLARKMAPVDEGDLEAAIEMVEEGGGRDGGGRFRAKVFRVEIDGEKSAGINREGRQHKVGDYAWLMHEHLAPFGHFNLGPRSQAKQAGQFEMVGGKFLERAMIQMSPRMVTRIIQALERHTPEWF